MVLCFVVVATLAAFPWGPLFAWSPVHPGYQRAQFSRSDVLYSDGTALGPAFHEICQYGVLAESFNEVKCLKKIAGVVCRNWSDCLRFATPFLGPYSKGLWRKL